MLAETVGSQSRRSRMQSASDAGVDVVSWSPLTLAAESPGPHKCINSEATGIHTIGYFMSALTMQRETAETQMHTDQTRGVAAVTSSKQR